MLAGIHKNIANNNLTGFCSGRALEFPSTANAVTALMQVHQVVICT